MEEWLSTRCRQRDGRPDERGQTLHAYEWPRQKPALYACSCCVEAVAERYTAGGCMVACISCVHGKPMKADRVRRTSEAHKRSQQRWKERERERERDWWRWDSDTRAIDDTDGAVAVQDDGLEDTDEAWPKNKQQWDEIIEQLLET